MRACGIDLGKVRVGVAVTDELGLLAHPRPYLDGRSSGRLVEMLVRLAADEGIDRFVVGLPRALDGREGRAARDAREFGRRLQERSGITVEFFDEWLSTVQARSRLRESGLTERESRGRIDSAAAAVMLQAWLEKTGGAK
jgi:putative Holliday junction resolvase